MPSPDHSPKNRHRLVTSSEDGGSPKAGKDFKIKPDGRVLAANKETESVRSEQTPVVDDIAPPLEEHRWFEKDLEVDAKQLEQKDVEQTTKSQLQTSEEVVPSATLLLGEEDDAPEKTALSPLSGPDTSDLDIPEHLNEEFLKAHVAKIKENLHKLQALAKASGVPELADGELARFDLDALIEEKKKQAGLKVKQKARAKKKVRISAEPIGVSFETKSTTNSSASAAIFYKSSGRGREVVAGVVLLWDAGRRMCWLWDGGGTS